MKSMVKNISIKLNPNDTSLYPSNGNLFSVGYSEELCKYKSRQFHRLVAKLMFVCKRSLPDFHPIIIALCTRVKSPNGGYWKKLL